MRCHWSWPVVLTPSRKSPLAQTCWEVSSLSFQPRLFLPCPSLWITLLQLYLYYTVHKNSIRNDPLLYFPPFLFSIFRPSDQIHIYITHTKTWYLTTTIYPIFLSFYAFSTKVSINWFFWIFFLHFLSHFPSPPTSLLLFLSLARDFLSLSNFLSKLLPNAVEKQLKFCGSMAGEVDFWGNCDV